MKMKFKSSTIKLIITLITLTQFTISIFNENKNQNKKENFNINKNNLQSGAILWQGFNFKWERKILNLFETPHRLGSFESLFYNTTTAIIRPILTFNSNSKTKNYLTSKINMYFTPGVNGDYSYPENFYSILFSNNTQPENENQIKEEKNKKENINKFYFEEQKVSLNFSDKINKTSKSAISFNKFNKTFNNILSHKNFQVVLNGFSLKMKCDNTKGICNSNGIWPYLFKLNILSCTPTPTLNLINCEFQFNLGRGSAPKGGSGKPLNDFMNYELELGILFIHKQGNKLNSIDHLIESQNEIFKKNDFLFKNITEEIKINKENKDQKKTVGITGFEFELLGGKYNDKGRYLEQFAFAVRNNKHSFDNKYEYISSIYSPYLTTYYSNVDMKLFTKVLYLDENVLIISPSEPIKGNICINDWTTAFYCKFVGLNEQTNDSKDIIYDGDNIYIK
jgi:hypothetical protein